MRICFLAISLSLFCLVSCQSPIEKKVIRNQINNQCTVGMYTSSPDGFFTNSFWLEGPEGVVLVDTQFIPSATKELVQIAEKKSGKQVVAAIVLHANPDKFNGTEYLSARGVEVVTSEQVRELIPAVDKLRREWFYERFKPDYPETLVLPKAVCQENATISLAGIKINFHVLGPSVSEAHIVVELDGHVFVGDMVANKFHSWLELGKVQEWLESLDYVTSLSPHKIYPGRGEIASANILEEQRAYIVFINDLVKKHHTGKKISREMKEKLIELVKKRYPSYKIPYFLNLGIPALWRLNFIP